MSGYDDGVVDLTLDDVCLSHEDSLRRHLERFDSDEDDAGPNRELAARAFNDHLGTRTGKGILPENVTIVRDFKGYCYCIYIHPEGKDVIDQY